MFSVKKKMLEMDLEKCSCAVGSYPFLWNVDSNSHTCVLHNMGVHFCDNNRVICIFSA